MKLFEQKKEELSQASIANGHKFSYTLEFPSSCIGEIVKEQMKIMLKKQGYEVTVKGKNITISETDSFAARLINTIEEQIRQNPKGAYKHVFSSPNSVISAEEIREELNTRLCIPDGYSVFMKQEGDNYEISACNSVVLFRKMAIDVLEIQRKSKEVGDYTISTALYTINERRHLERELTAANLKFVLDSVNEQIIVTNPYFNKRIDIKETSIYEEQNKVKIDCSTETKKNEELEISAFLATALAVLAIGVGVAIKYR